MKESTKELLEQLGKSHFGKALTEFLEEEINKLDTVMGVKTIEETIGRQKAVEILKEKFWFLNLKEPEKFEKNRYE